MIVSSHAKTYLDSFLIAFTDQLLSQFDGKTFYLVVRTDAPKFLSIGAGGNIVQTIEPDPRNPRLWDAANSKIVYIHLLDTAKFKSLTGVAPPPSPIDAAAFASAGVRLSSTDRAQFRKQKGIS